MIFVDIGGFRDVAHINCGSNDSTITRSSLSQKFERVIKGRGVMNYFLNSPEAFENLNDAQLDGIVGGWSFFHRPDIHRIDWKDGKYVTTAIHKYKDGKYELDKSALEDLKKINGGIYTGAVGI
ncbi:hypothetical protein MMB17_15575 [Methylobacterium organophilum]|uniref:hypothetical protein n=1 Tax=Methylobacterium organophilum TaxID=410 RepID=UPI001F1358CF|nr:hypothetical protein [Methylobacterium organophilum]UMY16135.1 hypothetical protein MMB17_15575 [Methylobacterium organophilum]